MIELSCCRGFREANIGYLIEWLLSQCGRPETEARHVCMRLFCSLVPHASSNPYIFALHSVKLSTSLVIL